MGGDSSHLRFAEDLGGLKARVGDLKDQYRAKQEEYKELDNRLDELERVQGDQERRLRELEGQASRAVTAPIEVVPQAKPAEQGMSQAKKASILGAILTAILTAIASIWKGSGSS